MSHADFTFEGAPNTTAFICRHVREGAPILYVAHDRDGDWQFLCGSAEHGAEDAVIVGVGHPVEGDPSISSLAKLCAGHFAERPNLTSAWTEVDESEAFIKECIADPGWSVQAIPAGEDEGEPAFAYTIGLFHNYQHAELIVVGLRVELMQEMLNDLGGRIKAGAKLAIGERLDGVLEGFQVTLREVSDPKSFKEHVGYARWFYEGKPFPLNQVVWPDKHGRFPNEAGTHEGFKRQQPLLP